MDGINKGHLCLELGAAETASLTLEVHTAKIYSSRFFRTLREMQVQ